MNFARVSIAGALAIAVTLGLLFLMHSLINQNLSAEDKEESIKIADIRMPETEIETRYETSKPDKPEEVETPPPELPEPELETPDVNETALNMTAPSMDGDLNLGSSGFTGDGEYMPIVAIAPEYPRRAAARGIEGFATVRFTVTTTGGTKDIEVISGVTVDGDETSIFNRAAERAAERFKFRPRIIDGTPVEVPGVTYRFVFELAD